MLRHVVLFTWAPEATQEQIAAFRGGLGPMSAAVESIRGYHHGPDAGINPANCDYAIVADFDDQAGYLGYRDHPAHREFVKTYVEPIAASRAAVQFEL
jgi:Stress responsive A/B Barrel Domain